jgi:hypothetical protein
MWSSAAEQHVKPLGQPGEATDQPDVTPVTGVTVVVADRGTS